MIALRVLNDDFGATIFRQNPRLSTLLQLSNEFGGVPLKCAKTLNVASKFHLICSFDREIQLNFHLITS